MNDDFNTAKALSVLFDLAKVIKNEINDIRDRKKAALLLVELGRVLGFFNKIEKKLATDDMSEQLIELMIGYRNTFKKEKQWAMADKIRDDLKSVGIILKDTKDGTRWVKS